MSSKQRSFYLECKITEMYGQQSQRNISVEKYATIDSFWLDLDLETREDRISIGEFLLKLSRSIAGIYDDTFH